MRGMETNPYDPPKLLYQAADAGGAIVVRIGVIAGGVTSSTFGSIVAFSLAVIQVRPYYTPDISTGYVLGAIWGIGGGILIGLVAAAMLPKWTSSLSILGIGSLAWSIVGGGGYCVWRWIDVVAS